jgi:hypothetical protein
MAPPTPAELVQQLQIAVGELRKAMSGSVHGIFRGSHEAALAEAQGLKIYKSPAKDQTAFSHLTDLENTENNLAMKESQINSLLGKIGEEMPGVMTRLKEKLQPLLGQSENYRETIARTQGLAQQLKNSDPNRLESAWANKGGLKIDAGRSYTSLVSTQMEQQASALKAQGIDPVLVSNPTAADAIQLAAIRQLPVSKEVALSRIAQTADNAQAAVTEAGNLVARHQGQFGREVTNSNERIAGTTDQVGDAGGNRAMPDLPPAFSSAVRDTDVDGGALQVTPDLPPAFSSAELPDLQRATSDVTLDTSHLPPAFSTAESFPNVAPPEAPKLTSRQQRLGPK